MISFPTHRGDRIRRIRKLRGLSQEALAANGGVATKTVSRAENGRNVSRRSIERIAAALGVPPGNFYDEADIDEFLSGRPNRTGGGTPAQRRG